MKRPTWSSAFILGAVWGFLEGTWFFLVPDVLLSYIAIASFRRALVAALGVVLGAMAAACLLYGLLSLDQGTAAIWLERFWSALPGFRATMLVRASGYLEAHGARGLLWGPESGLPFRVFVLEAYLCEFRWLESGCGRLRPGSNESCSRPSSLPERASRLAEPPERCFRCARTARSIGCS